MPADAYSRQVSVPSAPGSEMANVLVWIKNPPRPSSMATANAELRQSGERFVPHVVAVPVGSTVSFPNDDLMFHNVFSLSRAATFDLGRYPQGDTRARRFDKPGMVKVYCHLHSHMSAIVAVFDHPWFTTVAGDGTFTLERVAAGSFVLSGWHERIGSVDRAVTVEPNETTRVELTLPIVEP